MEHKAVSSDLSKVGFENMIGSAFCTVTTRPPRFYYTRFTLMQSLNKYKVKDVFSEMVDPANVAIRMKVSSLGKFQSEFVVPEISKVIG